MFVITDHVQHLANIFKLYELLILLLTVVHSDVSVLEVHGCCCIVMSLHVLEKESDGLVSVLKAVKMRMKAWELRRPSSFCCF